MSWSNRDVPLPLANWYRRGLQSAGCWVGGVVTRRKSCNVKTTRRVNQQYTAGKNTGRILCLRSTVVVTLALLLWRVRPRQRLLCRVHPVRQLRPLLRDIFLGHERGQLLPARLRGRLQVLPRRLGKVRRLWNIKL